MYLRAPQQLQKQGPSFTSRLIVRQGSECTMPRTFDCLYSRSIGEKKSPKSVKFHHIQFFRFLFFFFFFGLTPICSLLLGCPSGEEMYYVTNHRFSVLKFIQCKTSQKSVTVITFSFPFFFFFGHTSIRSHRPLCQLR